ncbi:putative mitochondrial ATP-binding cassette protein subfamily C, member 5, putative (ABCC5) [Leptomonas pyrrhocoris]|uniref:Putative mitochondrial ATP-binding cassette protein subfamily C, member 5, putative (ABCC5) n=1 Tax=Leptomonas pyrrhocoris TaxID=157538 RepID=A0A0M9FZ95_LEPPY|nr:putative mitochondrial ATP-binding cassette protein subfamily C, member 5, putative (ABCC5) [Leptomonas pyrrhocoris]KPA78916.1 putative mitochondrial ATP-binding cassette protein subfamily C, member 5, putative (ABCC5) [Leptomonas pyrrhocoris]|eukprot:XP_015657355.1 putative mitochondrial ATP-binding cassette protein subfamily C, member 5, putative (ABCC5) [Leptomonas pyrrhocoris]
MHYSATDQMPTAPPPGVDAERVVFPASSAEEALEELRARDGEQQTARSAWAEHVHGLWGAEPPYEPQPEDRSGVVLGSLFYSWMGRYIFQAAREELTEAGLPRPTRAFRAYNAGTRLSVQMQSQQLRRHAWDGYIGARVGVRRDAASDGVLRWVGVVQQYGTPRQLYAGVEWLVAPAPRHVGVLGRWLLCRGGGAPPHGPGAFHRGEVCGEHLFDLADGDTVATCELVEDVVFRLGAAEGGRGAAATERALRRELPASAHEPPRSIQVWWTIWTLFRENLLLLVLLGLLGDACSLLQPLLLKWFVAYLGEVLNGGGGGGSGSGSDSSSDASSSSGALLDGYFGAAAGWQRGVLLAFCMFVTMTVETVCSNKRFHVRRRCSLQVRNAISVLMFEKVFTMSPKAAHHPSYNAGRLANMLSTDVENIGSFISMFWALFSSPYILAIAFYQLYLLLGNSVFVGGAMVLVFAPLQGFAMKGLYAHFRERASATDHRVKATTELFSGIRVIKFMSWEPSFIARIEDMRKEELHFLKKIQKSFMMIFFLFNAAPGFVIASVFFTFGMLGHTLTPSIVFPALALFHMLTSFVSMLPFTFQMVSKLLVSLRRLNLFFDTEDDLVPLIADIKDFREDDQSSRDAPENTGHPPSESTAAAFVHAELSTYVAEELPKPADDAAPASAEPAVQPTDDTAAATAVAAPAEGRPAHAQPSFKEDAVYLLKTKALLEDVDLRIPRGKLTVVLGPTGCGKSTLLDSLIGALAVTRGRVACSRCVAYVPQQPWIMSATLRDNVVFFGAADDAAFERAVASSQLAADLALLAAGAATEIGEKGINLSGGQKARVSLARAVYADRDVYVLDDPLSALDAHVGERVMRECVCGALAHKTRVLATHQVSAAAYADYVVLLEEGRVAFQGTYAAYRQYARLHYDRSLSGLDKTSLYAARTVSELGPHEDLTTPGRAAAPREAVGYASPTTVEEGAAMLFGVGEEREDSPGDAITEGEARVAITESGEEKAVGAVPWLVYRRYMEACGGWPAFSFVIIFFVFTEVLLRASDVWLSLWSGGILESICSHRRLIVYVGTVLFAVPAGPSRDLLCFTDMRRASYRLHANLLRSLAEARLTFFDITPRGRLMNRMSRDMSQIDWDLPVNLDVSFFFFCYLISYVIIMTVSQPFILVILIPCALIYGRIFRFFCTANREMQRLLNISNSPVFSALNEVLTGRWTICTYERQQAMMQEVLRSLDRVFGSGYMQSMGSRWLTVRVELLGNVAVCSLALLGVVSTQASWMHINLGLLALSVSKASSITSVLSRFITVGASVEASMNCVERVLYYTDSAPAEDLGAGGAACVPATACGFAATEFGSLVLEHVDMRYRPGLPLVLRDVSFAVLPGQKVGVVGRTGSGKSTLLLALLRLVEVCGGCMRVCGRDARDYGVRELRQLFSMIPQDPLLFDGTVRSNVDPFGACGDAAVWAALRQVGMEERVRSGGGGLDARVQEGGSNFSVGQRQLLCLARALLKRGSAFLLMDEATANVDPALDRQIQLTVQQTFRDYTVVTIAHRLHTVAAYDVILVMDGGRAVEFGSPRALVNTEGSLFASMVQSMNEDARESFMASLNKGVADT